MSANPKAWKIVPVEPTELQLEVIATRAPVQGYISAVNISPHSPFVMISREDAKLICSAEIVGCLTIAEGAAFTRLEQAIKESGE